MTTEKNAKSFVAQHGDGLSQAEIDAAVEFMAGAEEKYSIKIIVAGGLGYLKVTAWMQALDREWYFEGDAGATTVAGLGVYWGHCYSRNIALLVREARRFQVNATSPFPPFGYVNVNFFDDHSKLLGHAHGGGLAVLNCVGGGTGTWK